MKNYKIAAALIGSFVLGAGVTSVLYAQGHAPTYRWSRWSTSKIRMPTPSNFCQRSCSAIKENGGEYLRGRHEQNDLVLLEQTSLIAVVIIKFPSLEAFKKFEDGE